ncbi:hypothetical protein OS493_012755 [Desmophyllum pertusum]|uniref:Uncharacterized protein n=1 Tax=Desmophyllum pertusum TaxID=174260 RepID=A0A9X0CZC8_9CNID|nr:hypothetical protein OS493_012755 [Desmophyllum pertusum]
MRRKSRIIPSLKYSIQDQVRKVGTLRGLPRPTGFAPTVIDLGNGMYEVLFLILDPGNYCVSAVLDHSLCDGMKDPPDYWFISGNTHGSNQPKGNSARKTSLLDASTVGR